MYRVVTAASTDRSASAAAIVVVDENASCLSSCWNHGNKWLWSNASGRTEMTEWEGERRAKTIYRSQVGPASRLSENTCRRGLSMNTHTYIYHTYMWDERGARRVLIKYKSPTFMFELLVRLPTFLFLLVGSFSIKKVKQNLKQPRNGFLFFSSACLTYIRKRWASLGALLVCPTC